MGSSTPYSESFFASWEDRSRSSAEAILPVVLERVRPTSAIDVGCGFGTWTEVLERRVSEVVSVDGEWIPSHARRSGFLERDLERPLAFDRAFDLAISVEVAEHLSPARAESFVADLVRLAPAVLFSAAIPGQGGADHINEQWQSYWARLFAQHGRFPHDVVRPVVWGDPAVERWYAQNALLYTTEPSEVPMLDVVHPAHYVSAINSRSAQHHVARLLRRSERSLRRAYSRAARR
jgi:SAM-dependent methyltransferase